MTPTGAVRRPSPPTTGPRQVLVDLYRAGVEAVAPGPALARALAATPTPADVSRVWILAMGKAAHPMARAAVSHLDRSGRTPAGGVIIGPEIEEAPAPLITRVGDHPLPGPGSLAAAQALGAVVELIEGEDEVWVLLSGGTTSLAAAPVAGLEAADLLDLYRTLLGSGLDITQMNTVRKRFSRWGAGRLAQALYPAKVRTFIISDVIGDDLAAVGSGPCVADPSQAGEVRDLLQTGGLWNQVPGPFREYLARTTQDPSLETPKPGHPAVENPELQVIASNRLAVQAVRRRAVELGWAVDQWPRALSGEAAELGRRLGSHLIEAAYDRPTCLVAGGETVVSMKATSSGVGGRCQELALSACREFAGANLRPDAVGPILLAAGTDGRDGPTDAAGAVVDGQTWHQISRTGRNPEQDLLNHNSYAALDAADALLKTGLTGTNVMDLVVGLAGKRQETGS